MRGEIVAGLTLWLVLSWFPPTAAAADGALECVAGNCNSGFGRARIAGGRLHEGTWTGGLRTGYGRETSADGSETWFGRYRDGSLNGAAIWVRRNENQQPDSFVGSFMLGRWHGYGVYTAADGSTYKGQHRAGARTGHGETRLANGLTYVGEHLDGSFHGWGRVVLESVLEYEGEWKEGIRSGTGSMTYLGIIRYEGDFADDVPNGTGTVFFDDEMIYHGAIHPTTGVGINMIARGDGTLYAGMLRDGTPHGRGAEATAGLQITTGTWRNGERVAEKRGDAASASSHAGP